MPVQPCVLGRGTPGRALMRPVGSALLVPPGGTHNVLDTGAKFKLYVGPSSCRLLRPPHNTRECT